MERVRQAVARSAAPGLESHAGGLRFFIEPPRGGFFFAESPFSWPFHPSLRLHPSHGRRGAAATGAAAPAHPRHALGRCPAPPGHPGKNAPNLPVITAW